MNWEVPLSRYLEEYIENTLGTLATNNRVTKVNFVEAALLLQGTASVYSKKVEFLWQNTLKMLDTLASQKALEEATEGAGGTSAEGRGKRRKGPGHDFNDFSSVRGRISETQHDIKLPQHSCSFVISTYFMCLPFQVPCPMTKSCNMKEDSSGPACSVFREKKAAALNFISVTPRQLIEKEGREQKETRINLYAKGGGHKDLIGHKEDFRLVQKKSVKCAKDITTGLCSFLAELILSSP